MLKLKLGCYTDAAAEEFATVLAAKLEADIPP